MPRQWCLSVAESILAAAVLGHAHVASTQDTLHVKPEFLATEEGLQQHHLQSREACPLARFDDHVSNRYIIEPVRASIRVQLELRQQGEAPCAGPPIQLPEPLSFESVQFEPDSQNWQGVLRVPEGIEENEWNGEGIVEACDVVTGACLARLQKPEHQSLLQRFGVWAPRDMSNEINVTLALIFIVLIASLCAGVAAWIATPKLMNTIFEGDTDTADHKGDPEAVAATPEAEAADKSIPGAIPDSNAAIADLASQVGSMAGGVVALLLVCIVFIFQRELNYYSFIVMQAFPVVLVMLHLIVSLGSVAKLSLYNELLRDRLHIVFEPDPMPWERPTLQVLILSFVLFMSTAICTIVADMRNDDCTDGECTYLMRSIQFGVKVWALAFPACWCSWLVFKADLFQWRLIPLNQLFDGSDMPAEKVPSFLGSLQTIPEAMLIRVGQLMCNSDGIKSVTAEAIAARCRESDSAHAGSPRTASDRAQTPRVPAPRLPAAWQKVEGSGPGWWIMGASLWTWKLRLKHSANRAGDFRKLFIVCQVALTAVLFFALAAHLFMVTRRPLLDNITTSLGDLSPPFDAKVFNYNLFVQHKVTMGHFQIVSNKDFVSTARLRVRGTNKIIPEQSWTRSVYDTDLPMLLRAPKSLKTENAVSFVEGPEDDETLEELPHSRVRPVLLEFTAKGSGHRVKYRITVVKVQTRELELVYNYTASTDLVREVAIRKEIEKTHLETSRVDGADLSLAAYVPEDVDSVRLSLRREMRIFGPSGGRPEIRVLRAARRMRACPLKEDVKHENEKKQEAATPDRDKGCVRKEELQLPIKGRVTGVPVQLRPDGAAPIKFFVSVVPVVNRLINLELAQSLLDKENSAGGTAWSSLAPVQAFNPLRSGYEVFFDIPMKASAESPRADSLVTIFLKVKPQGDSRTNWLEASLEASAGADVEPFCGPTGVSSPDMPLDPTVASSQAELACGLSSASATEPLKGFPTRDLVILSKDGKRAFRNHFYIRYRFRPSQPMPFVLKLQVKKFLQDTDDRVYTFKFFPHVPATLGLSLAVPSIAAELGLAFAQGLEVYDLPLFISPPFSADVVSYYATVPPGGNGSLLVRLANEQSFWATAVGEAPQTPGLGESVEQRVVMRHPENGTCDGQVADKGGGVDKVDNASLCPLKIRVHRLQEGFPRTYEVNLQEGRRSGILFLGYLKDEGSVPTPQPLPGFRPDMHRNAGSLSQLPWSWRPPRPGLPALPVAPAPAAMPAGASAPLSSSSQPATVSVDTWFDGEVKPTGILLAFTSVAGTNLSLAWNDQAIPSTKLGKYWWQAELAGKALAEVCWCESVTKTDQECRRLLFKKAPNSTLLYMQPNNCRLSVDGRNKTVSEYMVGHSWKGSSALGTQALEAAFEGGTDNATVNLAQRQYWVAGRKRQLRRREWVFLEPQKS